MPTPLYRTCHWEPILTKQSCPFSYKLFRNVQRRGHSTQLNSLPTICLKITQKRDLEFNSYSIRDSFFENWLKMWESLYSWSKIKLLYSKILKIIFILFRVYLINIGNSIRFTFVFYISIIFYLLIEFNINKRYVEMIYNNLHRKTFEI